MIQAVIFDLDGTLVQTEKLKALSYARAAVELCPYTIGKKQVLDAYKDVVGQPRREVAQALVERFDLQAASRARMDEFGVTRPWQAFVQVRLNYYKELVADPDVLRDNQWSHNVALLEKVREMDCQLALATMSRCKQARHVLEVLGFDDRFDFVATRDDVEHGKPDPAIYHLVASELEVDPSDCLVVEDSPSGVEAALAAGMNVVAVSTPFTRQRLHNTDLLQAARIVDEPDRLPAVVERVFEQNR